jgi:hypothetical protein
VRRNDKCQRIQWRDLVEEARQISSTDRRAANPESDTTDDRHSLASHQQSDNLIGARAERDSDADL